MGIRIVVPGVTFQNYIDIVDYPVKDQLSLLHYLGTDAERSATNHADGFADAVVGANITYQPLYAEFAGLQVTAANHIVTADNDSASVDVSRVAVFQFMDDGVSPNNRCIFGEFNGASNGSGIMPTSAFFADGAYKTASLGLPNPPHVSFHFAAMTYDDADGGVLRAYRGVGGKLVAGPTATGVRIPSAAADRIGGSTSGSTYVGDARIAAVAKHRKALTVAELEEVYFYLRSRYSKLGLTIA